MSDFLHRSWSILLQTVTGAYRSRSISLLLASCLWILASPPLPAIIDTNDSGISDTFEIQYNNGQPLDPDADPDLDGWSNLQEANAGTDPYDANPPSGIVAITITNIPEIFGPPELAQPAAIAVTWPTIPGKLYTIFCSTDLTSGNWIPFDTPRIGDGDTMGIGNPLTDTNGEPTPMMFWRVGIEDTDSDGDGFYNHEEYLEGTDPFEADRDADGLPDAYEITFGLDPADNGTSNPVNGASGDLDGDGHSNIDELLAGTASDNPDDYPDQLLSIGRRSQHQFSTGAGTSPNFNGVAFLALWNSPPPAVNSVPSAALPFEQVGTDLVSNMPYPEEMPDGVSQHFLVSESTYLSPTSAYTTYYTNENAEDSTYTFASLEQNRLWLKICPNRKSAAAQEIPYLFVAHRRTYNYGPNGVILPPSGEHPAQIVYKTSLVNFKFDPNATTSKPIDIDAQLHGSGINTQTICRFLLTRVNLSWKAFAGFDNVDGHIDPWTAKRNGQRIFPDFKNPKDTKPRAKLQLVITTSPALAGKTVYVKSFDVDDSTDEAFDVEIDPVTQLVTGAVIDTNGKKGDDNLTDYLSTDKKGQFWDNTTAAWGENTSNAIIDANGKATFDFRVGMQPGNNYRVVASLTDEAMYADVQSDNPAVVKYLGPDPAQIVSAPASPLLTVWRKLWVENDSMKAFTAYTDGNLKNDMSWDLGSPVIINSNTSGPTEAVFGISRVTDYSSFTNLENGSLIVGGHTHSVVDTSDVDFQSSLVFTAPFTGNVPNGSIFRLYDDDDFGLAGPALPRANLINEVINAVYRPAFIKVEDAKVFNLDTDLDFLVHRSVNGGLVPVGDEYWTDHKDITDKNQCWAAQVIAAYQDKYSNDGDPLGESLSEGLTPGNKRDFCVVYVETIRDEFDPLIRVGFSNALALVELGISLNVAHEIAHMPGTASKDTHHAEEGIMAAQIDVNLNNPAKFNPISIKRFRNTSKWQKPE